MRQKRTSVVHPRPLLVVCALTAFGAVAVPPLVHAQTAPVVAPAITGGTTVLDHLKLQTTGDMRTMPTLPQVGAWGVVIGQPPNNAQGHGIEIDDNGQAVVYPGYELLDPAAGTIEFSVLPATGVAADVQRTLLDTFSGNNGPQRIAIVLTGAKLTLTYTGQDGSVKTIETAANWAAAVPHTVTVAYDAVDLALYVDARLAGSIAKPSLAPREPLAVVLGNNRDYKAPAHAAISELRLSTAKAPIAAASNPATAAATSDELSLRMAQGYQRRLYPVFEKLRTQGRPEVDLGYAFAYADIGDLDHALATVQPIVANVNHPLNVLATFLRSDLLTRQGDFTGAFDQLQTLAVNKDIGIAVRAQVRQAAVLFAQGNQPESLRLLGDIIAKYTDLPDVNEAYLMIGLDRFKNGDFQKAYEALKFMSMTSGKSRITTPIGLPLDIKVADADLSVRLNDAPLRVTISTKGGDKEFASLRPAFSKGVYAGTIETVLGQAKVGDHVLQLVGGDKISISYDDRLSSGATDQKRVVGLTVATDGEIIALAQSALDVYREVQRYLDAGVLDKTWEVVAPLPKTASAFFRDPETGALRRKGFHFDPGYLSTVKAGQGVYVELDEPDGDISDNPDSMTVELNTRLGKSMPLVLKESGPHTGIFGATVKTSSTGQGVAGTLEVGVNDVITAKYLDKDPAQGTADPVHLSNVSIRASSGILAVGLKLPDPDSDNKEVFLKVYRVSGNNSKLTITLADRDLDTSDAADTFAVKMAARDGASQQVTLTETGTHTGQFTGPVQLTTDPAATAGPTVFKAKAGDYITVSYLDQETSEGAPATRDYTLRSNIAEDAKITFEREVVTYPKIEKGASQIMRELPTTTYVPTTAITPGFSYRVRLDDPDLVPTNAGVMKTKITIKSSNGSSVDVPLEWTSDATTQRSYFEGNFFPRLGDGNSPSRAYFSQTGSVVDIDADKASNLWFLPAVNVQGNDTVTVVYVEPLTADMKKNVTRNTPMRVAADAEISMLNAQGNPLLTLKPGLTFELQIDDANGDLTPKRDTLKAQLSSGNGDKIDVELTETDTHSGIFSAMVKTAAGEPVATDKILQAKFDGLVTISYNDQDTIAGTPAVRTATLASRPLEDADGMLLTKVYDDPKFELETLIRLGEARYAVGAAELAQTKAVDGKPRSNADLQDAAHLLQEVVDNFPTSDYVVESLFLIGKIRREEGNFDEAQQLFNKVIQEYPDNELVPQALFQMVLLNYAKDDIDGATESAMKLVYGYPTNSLVADAVLRIAEYYYSKKQYDEAAYIYKRLLERFPDNTKADLIEYRMATAYYRSGTVGKATDDADERTRATSLALAVRYYLQFAADHADNELADDAMYWAADSSLKQNNARRAYTILTKLLVDYKSGDKAAAARTLRDRIKQQNPQIEADADY